MENVIKLELGSVLPGGGSACGGCGRRLETVMQTCRGLKKAHLALDGEQPAALCLHYDPDLVGVDQLRRMAQQAGLEIAARYKHDTIPITGMDCSDCALVVEHSLGRMPGVIHAAVNYA